MVCSSPRGSIMQKPHFSLHCKDVQVLYDTNTALQIPDLTFSGNTIAILGHNGAGKSTLLKAALGLLKVVGSLSTYCIENGIAKPINPAEGMAFCPENGAVFADVTVEAYIKLWCRIKCNDARYYMRAGSKYIDLLEISPLLKKLGRELSKGQRRRVQTAIGFLTQPKVFMFDEPFCGLDIKRTFDLQTILTQESYSTAVVLASHRMEVIERIADYVVVLENGAVVAAGSPADVAKALCGSEFAIVNASNRIELCSQLTSEFPLSVVSEVGSEIRVAGPNLQRPEIDALVKTVDANGALLVDVKPNLIDAVNYHFKVQSLRSVKMKE